MEKPGRGKVNPRQNLFGSRRPREANPIYMYVGAARLSEAIPINFGLIRRRESKPRSQYVQVQKVKGIILCTMEYVGATRMSETSPNKFWRN